MIKRELSAETKTKILKCAINILEMHGSLAGNRCCQDWSGDESENPEVIFNKIELDDISYNYEIENSRGDDYDKNHHGLGDEMVASFAMASMLQDILKGL
jgi:hypothetical protein